MAELCLWEQGSGSL